MVGVVDRATTRMQTMLDDLLVFTQSRLSDLRTLLSDATDELRAAFPGVEMDLQLDGALPGSWDRRRVLQLLVNLLVNATRYGDGRIVFNAHEADQLAMRIFTSFISGKVSLAFLIFR